MGDIFSSIKESVMRRIEPAKETGEGELYEIIDGAIKECTAGVMLSAGNKALYRRKIFNDIKRLDILQELIEDDGITEIMINGWERIFIERDGRISLWDKHFESPKRLTDIVQRIAAASNKIVNEAVPISDTRLADGSRVNIVMNPIAINGPIVTIRKFYDTPLSMERMIELGSLSRETADFLQKLVAAKYNIFISGDGVIIGLS